LIQRQVDNLVADKPATAAAIATCISLATKRGVPAIPQRLPRAIVRPVRSGGAHLVGGGAGGHNPAAPASAQRPGYGNCLGCAATSRVSQRVSHGKYLSLGRKFGGAANPRAARADFLMEQRGFEPQTSAVQALRRASTNFRPNSSTVTTNPFFRYLPLANQDKALGN
jgi:hypothetical protein